MYEEVRNRYDNINQFTFARDQTIDQNEEKNTTNNDQNDQKDQNNQIQSINLESNENTDNNTSNENKTTNEIEIKENEKTDDNKENHLISFEFKNRNNNLEFIEKMEPRIIPLNEKTVAIPKSSSYITVNRNHFVKDDPKLKKWKDDASSDPDVCFFVFC